MAETTVIIAPGLEVLRDDPRWIDIAAKIKQAIGRNFRGTILVVDLTPDDVLLPTTGYLTVDNDADTATLHGFLRIEIEIPGRGQREPAEGVDVRIVEGAGQ